VTRAPLKRRNKSWKEVWKSLESEEMITWKGNWLLQDRKKGGAKFKPDSRVQAEISSFLCTVDICAAILSTLTC
jgi:hypothetical protein